METILAGIRATGSYSKHLCDKASDFLRSGKPYFKREAQFPPEVIRRPEKNLYFATTFNMVVSKLFLACHREMFGDNTGAAYVIEQCQHLDRCSMRLMQNMLLQLKPFCVQMELVFKRRADGSRDGASNYERRFVAARKRCFGKLLNVALVTGSADESLDIDGFLRGADFQSSFLAMTYSETGARRADIDSFRDMLYRNAYERFYVCKALHDDNPWFCEEERVDLEKLQVLCDSYNFLFDDALDTAESGIAATLGKNRCYFLLMKALVQLKKMKNSDAAISTLKQGIVEAGSIENLLERTVETAFLENALNFVWLIQIVASKEEGTRRDRLGEILTSEHGILQAVCKAFLSARAIDLEDRRKLLHALFILTTIVENISKLNALCGRRYETIDLYGVYEHILDIVAGRMQREAYRRSFEISFSHALVNIRVAVASGYAAANCHQKAYDITRQLLHDVEQYDITGDYRGFVLNAHAVNAARIGRTDESIDCLVQMAAIYLDYNEPYMIKVAMNRLAPFLAEQAPDSHAFLHQLGIIDAAFHAHDETAFLVSSAVDLENPLLGGLEQLIFGKRPVAEARAYDREDCGLKAAFKSYGHWRQIAARDRLC
jgi:hypothetical protein